MSKLDAHKADIAAALELGVSKAALARLCGVSKSTMRYYIDGHVVPRPEVIERKRARDRDRYNARWADDPAFRERELQRWRDRYDNDASFRFRRCVYGTLYTARRTLERREARVAELYA